MEKNTTLYESMVNELVKMLHNYEFDLNKTKQSKDKCHEICDCEHCHCHNDEKDEEDNEFTPNFEVLSYTDEDFKDKEKLEDYVDELENLLETYENLSETEETILSFLCQNHNISEHIENLIDHAYDIYNASVKEKEEQKRKDEEAKKKQDVSSSQIKELVRRYIDDVVAKTLNIGGITLSKSKRTALETSYTDFANWILKQ